MPQSEDNSYPPEIRDKTDEELYAELRRDHPVQCAGCAQEIAWGEVFIPLEYIVGYTVDRGGKGYVKLTRPRATYDVASRYVHIQCLNIVPKKF